MIEHPIIIGVSFLLAAVRMVIGLLGFASIIPAVRRHVNEPIVWFAIWSGWAMRDLAEVSCRGYIDIPIIPSESVGWTAFLLTVDLIALIYYSIWLIPKRGGT